MTLDKPTHRHTRWLDFPSLLFAIGLCTIVVIRLAVTTWTSYLDRQENLVMYAFLLGAWLGYAEIRHRFHFPVGILFGLVVCFWLMGQLYFDGLIWATRVNLLVVRLCLSFNQLFSGKEVTDAIQFYFISSYIIWLFTYISAYRLVRFGSAMFNLSAGSILLLLVDRYDLNADHRVLFFFSFMLFALLLLTRTNLIHQQRRWMQTGSLRGYGTIGDITRAAIKIIIGLLTVVWIIPVMVSPNGPVARMWRSMSVQMSPIRSQASNAFASLQGDSNPVNVFSSNYLSLGTRVDQETTPIFSVRVHLSDPEKYWYYWRARSFDTYQNGQWTNHKETSFPFSSQVEASSRFDWKKWEDVTFSVTIQSEKIATFYTEQNPSALSMTSRAYGLALEDGSIDLNRLEPDGILNAGDSYQFIGQKSNVTIDDLILAGSDYPDWITSNYLQVPADIAASIQVLSSQLTANSSTPYEKTVSITRYLRMKYFYQPQIDPAPAGRDPVEHFLFTAREGFCTYYASAEVLLLRAAGVPARLVVGYAQGEFDEQFNEFHIRSMDIHAWPEVFFPGYGWVVFEPTVIYEPLLLPRLVDTAREELRQEELDRRQRVSVEDQQMESPQISDAEVVQVESEGNPKPLWLIWVAIGVVLTSVAILALRSQVRQRALDLPVWMELTVRKTGVPVPKWLSDWAQYARLTETEKLYHQVSIAFRLLGCQIDLADTPRERHHRWVLALPEIQDDSQDLLRIYELCRFSQHPVELDYIKQIRTRMIRSIWIAYLHRTFYKYIPLGK